MTWVKVPSEIHSAPDVDSVGNSAFGLHVRLVAYSNTHGTDGAVSMRAAKTMGANARDLGRLEAAGWLAIDGDVITLARLMEYQPAAAHVASVSHARSIAGRSGGLRSGESRAKQSASLSRSKVLEANTEQANEARTVPYRSEQIPPPPLACQVPSAPAAQTPAAPPESPPPEPEDRERPMPLDWQPHPAAVAEMAAKLGVSEDALRRHAEEFRGYWTIGGGAGRARRNWSAAWRDHARRRHAEGALDPAAAPPSTPRRGRPLNPLEAQLEADRAAGRDASVYLRPRPIPPPKVPAC